jgi:hypothetical protein
MNQKEIEQSTGLKEKGITNHTNNIRFVKGLPDFQEGAIVTIDLYNDKITVNDNQEITLDNLRKRLLLRLGK